jgi:hypothetical protein
LIEFSRQRHLFTFKRRCSLVVISLVVIIIVLLGRPHLQAGFPDDAELFAV